MGKRYGEQEPTRFKYKRGGSTRYFQIKEGEVVPESKKVDIGALQKLMQETDPTQPQRGRRYNK